jgi:hypothetical protein
LQFAEPIVINGEAVKIVDMRPDGAADEPVDFKKISTMFPQSCKSSKLE